MGGSPPQFRHCLKGGQQYPITDVIAAINIAVNDGVDIISLLIGYYELSPFYDDYFGTVVFDADRKRASVVLVDGNTGPTTSSVINVALWITTVGAGTVDQLFSVGLKLGDGTIITEHTTRLRRAP